MPDVGLLVPGVGAHDPDDLALVRALVTVERAWTRVLAPHEAADALDAAATRLVGQDEAAFALAARLAASATASGNPVVPLVELLRAEVGPTHAPAVHEWLTSQDVLDSALILVVKDAGTTTVDALDVAIGAIAALAERHRATPALAHTLTQAALATTLGARMATWVQALGEARASLTTQLEAAPLAYGGAAGTLAGPGPDALSIAKSVADALGLACPVAPWHVTRHPTERLASALAEAVSALGKFASDVLVAVRPEVGELSEPFEPGRGGSSSMPFKRNPTLAITMRRSAIAAPHALAQVYSAAGLAVDERPDGAWHAEWPALRELARHAVIASRAGATLASGLEVNTDAVARNVARFGPADADSGLADELVTRILARYGPGAEPR